MPFNELIPNNCAPDGVYEYTVNIWQRLRRSWAVIRHKAASESNGMVQLR